MNVSYLPCFIWWFWEVYIYCVDFVWLTKFVILLRNPQRDFKVCIQIINLFWYKLVDGDLCALPVLALHEWGSFILMGYLIHDLFFPSLSSWFLNFPPSFFPNTHTRARTPPLLSTLPHSFGMQGPRCLSSFFPDEKNYKETLI